MKFPLPFLMLVSLMPLLGWGPLAHAQVSGALHGRVSAPRGELAAGVAMTLRRRNGFQRLSTSSGAGGVYRFDNVAPGEYLLEAVDASSTFGALELLTLRPGEEAVRDVRLKVRGTPTEIQVTASGTPRSLQEVAKAADAIDGGEISRRAEYAVAEAVRNVPGVRVKQSGGPARLLRFRRGVCGTMTPLC